MSGALHSGLPMDQTTERKVMNLVDHVTRMMHRHQQRPPVYARSRPHHNRPRKNNRSPAGCRQLELSHPCTMQAPQSSPLWKEQRSKLLYDIMRLETELSSDACPSRETLWHLLRYSAEADTDVRRCCLRLLRRVAIFQQSLYHSVQSAHKSDWSLLWDTVWRRVTSGGATDLANREDRLLDTELLDLLVSLLEEDIQRWWRDGDAAGACRHTVGPGEKRSPRDRLQRSPSDWPLLAKVVWSDQQLDIPVKNTDKLCHWLVAAHGPRRRDAHSMTIRRLLLRLMTMVAEIVRIKDQESFLGVTGDMQTLADCLSRTVQNEDLDWSAVHGLLCGLRPAWLAAQVAAAQLHLRHGRARLSRPLTLQLIYTYYMSNGENCPPVTTGETAARQASEPPGNRSRTAVTLGQNQQLQHAVSNIPCKRLRLDSHGSESSGDGEQYGMLVYHLLCAHLLHTGVMEVRLSMTRGLLGEPLQSGQPPPGRSAAAAGPPCQSDLITYRRELSWLQDRLWLHDGALQTGSQHGLYMRTITKL